MLLLADYLQHNTLYEPVIAAPKTAVHDFCRTTSSISVIDLNQPAPAAQPEQKRHEPIQAKAVTSGYRQYLPQTLIDRLYTWRHTIRASWERSVWGQIRQMACQFEAEIQQAEALLRQHQPSAILAVSDRHTGKERILVEAAARLKIPVILVTHALVYPAALASKRADNPNHCLGQEPYRWFKTWLKWRYPSQWRLSGDQQVIYYHPLVTGAYAQLGILQDNPWVHGTGQAALICVSGEEMRQDNIGWGLEAAKIRVTGQPEHDLLYAAFSRKAEVLASFADSEGWDVDKPNIVYAIPPLAEHYLHDEVQYWRGIETTLEVLTQFDANILVSLHPKVTPEAYQPLLQRYSAHLIPLRLRDFMPLAEVVVNTYSSTVDWCVLLAIPTIIADFSLRSDLYQFEDFDQPWLLQAPTPEALAEHLRTLLAQPESRAQMIEKLQAVSAHKAPFDGQACARIAEVVKSLVEHS